MESILEEWRAHPDRDERIVHVRTEPARTAIYAEPKEPLPDAVLDALAGAGITRLYRHQAHSIDRVRAGIHTVLAAGTASGKTLAYQVPMAAAAAEGLHPAAIALYPTKALARDQLRSFGVFRDLVTAVYDGDTPREDRRWIRAHADVILTNPDMLHIGILPHHSRWAALFSRLQFVVVDELHVLRGIFGSHVAHVLRRIRRIARHYGADPTFVFTSATIGNPGELASWLAGLDVEVVSEDVSPVGEKTFVLWNPELTDPELGIRGSSLAEATVVFSDLVSRDVHTIAFARSRKASELIYRWARERLDDDRADRIAPYRGGYLAVDRRAVEERLASGDLLGVAATNALELGIDIGGLDAAIVTTFPGTIASFRQQAGRAGRTLRESMAILIGGQDALDQYYMSHPDELFEREPEAAVVNPANPHVLTDHIGCAAYELPLVPEDREFLGDDLEEAVPTMVGDGRLRLRDGKLYWAKRRAPAPDVNIRTSGGAVYTIGQHGGELLGSIDEERAFSQCHPGAIYLHQGDSYVVEELDLHRREVVVRRADVGYYTQPKVDKDILVRHMGTTKRLGRIDVHWGKVEVESQVVAYQRKEISGGAILSTEPLDLPARTFETESFWFTFGPDVIEDADLGWTDLPGALHAAEHTGIAMLPLFAICDRWDVGGLSTAIHPDTGGAVYFIYDGYPGGAGIAGIGYARAGELLRATRQALLDCPCATGCPSCVQSPKCGNFNDPLDKDGAERLLRVVLL